VLKAVNSRIIMGLGSRSSKLRSADEHLGTPERSSQTNFIPFSRHILTEIYGFSLNCE